MHKSPDGIEHEAMYWKESGMIALAVAAIQELSAEVNSLKERIATLEAE
jgi:cell division protein FtsB